MNSEANKTSSNNHLPSSPMISYSSKGKSLDVSRLNWQIFLLCTLSLSNFTSLYLILSPVSCLLSCKNTPAVVLSWIPPAASPYKKGNKRVITLSISSSVLLPSTFHSFLPRLFSSIGSPSFSLSSSPVFVSQFTLFITFHLSTFFVFLCGKWSSIRHTLLDTANDVTVLSRWSLRMILGLS